MNKRVKIAISYFSGVLPKTGLGDLVIGRPFHIGWYKILCLRQKKLGFVPSVDVAKLRTEATRDRYFVLRSQDRGYSRSLFFVTVIL